MSKSTFVQHSMEKEYLAIERFAVENDNISYLQFDNYLLQKVSLFSLPEHERFISLEKTLDKIITALPSLKRIFSKPITRLKDQITVLPVEATRIINSATLGHIALHTELWGNITSEGLKPRKLKTITHEEEYQIYENIAFSRLIDVILSFVKSNIQLLKDILFSCQTIQFNMLERTNHLMHFLAIGKLHVSYARAQDKYRDTYARCLDKLYFIDKTIRSKLNSPVYKICKKEHSKISLKKTNVFRLQKDYKQVYLLLKYFSEKGCELNDDNYDQTVSLRSYSYYCELISLFAIAHFNFEFSEKTALNFFNINALCKFKDWKLRIKRVNDGQIDALLFTVNKTNPYSICLIFDQSARFERSKLNSFKKKYPCNEYLFAVLEPDENLDSVYLNLYDLSSFRRIQQLILRAMIYSDQKRTVCPFCGSPLTHLEHGYECPLCRTLIEEKTCPNTNQIYYATKIKGFKPQTENAFSQSYSQLLKDKYFETMLYFRNITPINAQGKPLCPHCNTFHD